MSGMAKYFIVEASAMPEIYRKVAQAKNLLETGEKTTVNVYFATSKSLHTSRATLYSLYMICAPLQSPYIAPTSIVPPHHARLSVSFCSVFLCGLGVTFAPLRLALTLGERAVSGSI